MDNTGYESPLSLSGDENIKSKRSGHFSESRDFRRSEPNEYTDEEHKYDEDRKYDDQYSDRSLERDRYKSEESAHSEEDDSGYFYIGISGQIQSGEFKDDDGLAVKYTFVSKGLWRREKGNETGISQHSFKSSGVSKRVVWNFPFEIRYSSKTIKDWPQIVVYVSGKDFAGREVVLAYG